MGGMTGECPECKGVGYVKIDNVSENVDKDLNCVDTDNTEVLQRQVKTYKKAEIALLTDVVESHIAKPKRKYVFKNKK